MKVAVTGGAGFIGSYVVEELQKRGHQPLVIDHHGSGHQFVPSSNTNGSHVAPDVFLADVRDATAMAEVAAHVDAVIHLAAVLGTQETISNPRPSAETNTLGALNVFEAANQYDLPLVYAGVGNHWMREHGTGAYTISKTAAEDFVRMHVKYRGSKFSIVRPVNAYGPGQSVARPYGTSKVRKIMPALICRALTGTNIEIYGDGTQISDCVYVRDVAKTFVRTLEVTARSGPLEKPVEVGPAESHTVNEVAEMVISAVANYDLLTPGFERVGIDHVPMRPGEVPNAVVSADTSTLKQIGMSTKDFVTLHTGISFTVDWFVRNWLPSYLEKVN